MATDGEIDFRTYKREQLDSAVSRMDRSRYPINYRNLAAEYQRRRLEEEKAVVVAPEVVTGGLTKVGAIESNDVLEFATATNQMPGPRLGSALREMTLTLVGSERLRMDGVHVSITAQRSASCWACRSNGR